jgi:putative oxidoreductase
MPHREDAGLLLLRLGVGGLLVAHGTQKLFGWFGDGGLEGTGQAMEQMGFKPGRESALAAGLGETGGGTLLALGLATPAAGAVAAGTMAVAASFHRPNGFFAMNGGLELPALVGATAGAIGVAGPGRYSLDHLTCHVLDRPWVLATAFAAAAAGAAVVIARRARDTAPPAS